MNKLEHYINLNYAIEIVNIPVEDGGGYTATIPQLGRYSFVGDGETISEAIDNLNKIKGEIFQEYIDKDIEIPLPINANSKKYSGKLLLRIPQNLHASLSIEADKNEISLNQYILCLLSNYYMLPTITSFIQKWDQSLKAIYDKLDSLIYKSEHTYIDKDLQQQYAPHDYAKVA